MAQVMQKFRKKPVVVEAVQFFPDRKPWPAGVREYHDCTPGGCTSWGLFEIETLEGWSIVRSGDWIVKGVKGELYPCKPDIFADSHEAVDV